MHCGIFLQIYHQAASGYPGIFILYMIIPDDMCCTRRLLYRPHDGWDNRATRVSATVDRLRRGAFTLSCVGRFEFMLEAWKGYITIIMK